MATVSYPGMTVPQKPKTTEPTGVVSQSLTVPRPPAMATSTGTIPKSSPVPMPPQLNASNYRNADWQDQLKAFQSDRNLAQAELTRATNQANLYKATGDNAAYDRAQKWIGQINTATGGAVPMPNNDPNVQRYNQYRQQQDELMNRMQSMINQPVQYNPEADPRYQAYRQLAQARAADASRQTMEALNSRGILNSSVTATQLGEIQQGAEQQAMAAIPEFYAQAMQQRQLDIQNAADMLRTTIGEDQRYLDNQYRDRTFDRGVLESDRSFDRGVLENDRAFERQGERDAVADSQWNRTFEYQQTRDQIADQQYKQKFDEDVRRFGLEYAANEAYRSGQLALSQDDNDRQWASLDYEMSSGGEKYRGLNANQVLDNIRNNYTEPIVTTNKFGQPEKQGEQITKDSNRRYEMFLDVIDSGLPTDTETNQVLKMLGISNKEINEFKARAQKEIGGSGN